MVVARVEISCEPAAVTDASTQNPRLVYVKYMDHVFFRNVHTPPTQSVLRETVGWVKKENDEIMLIECDRPILQGYSGFNGVVIVKNCVVTTAELQTSGFEHILKSTNSLPKKRVRAPRQRSEKLNSPTLGVKKH